ncbi:MAG TPA: TolC family protein, partial [Thermoanaerobaculia bacterium]|nr:TolC family protein [Thermoanaerobaculia bacterium]
TATVAERGAALELSAARRELLQGVAERLAGVASRYWELAAAEQSLAILRAAEERSGTLLATVKRQVEADLTPRAELIQLAANQVAKQADTIAGERELYAARERLALAVGAAAWPARELAAGDELPTGSPELPEAGSGELPARQGWLRRGDLLAAEDRREAAALQVAAAEDALKPRLDLLFTPSWNGLAVGSSAGDFFAAAYRDLPGPSASLSLSFTRPLGNLEARSQLLAAQAGLARAEIREELLRRSIASATAIALDAVRRDAEEVARAAEAVSLFSQAAENEEKKLKAGTSTVIDVITQRDRAAGAQLRLVGARLTLALARVELRLALGAFVVATPRGPALERVELGPLLRGGAP